MSQRRNAAHCQRTQLARQRFGGLVACLAVLVAFAHVIVLGHMVFVPHVRCEHGRLVHQTHEEGADPGAIADATGIPESAIVKQKDDEADGSSATVSTTGSPHLNDAHDHCQAFGIAVGLVTRSSPATHGDWLCAGAANGLSVSVQTQAIPVLLLAPKTSPTV